MVNDVVARAPSEYPVEWEADVVLRDGTTMHVRPIVPADAPALQRFHMAQSERSTYMRFFAPLERLSDADLHRFTNVDYRDRVALVAVREARDGLGNGQDIVGVARYDRVNEDEAEVAFNIADSQQGRGLGSILLEHIAAAARERGIRRFTADVLPQNGRMLAVFREAGYAVRQHVEDGVVTVDLDLDPTERSRAVIADREHRGEARSMQGLLSARSIALVGTWTGDSRERAMTDRLFDTLTRSSVGIDIIAVGVPEDRDLPQPVRRCKRIEELESVELAVLAIEPRRAIEAVPPLGRAGARGLVIASSGYAETGPDGLALQRELIRAAHTAGMRVIGPASFGLFTTGEHRIAATLASELPGPGRVGLFCQSSPMAVTLLSGAVRRNIGVSTFLSSGHRADVSGNDVMQYWQDDSATDVVCLCLESIGNPRKFSRISRRLSAVKPVVVVTAGRSGQVVPPGHAVRSTRAPRRMRVEMLRQSGVIRASSVHHMLDIAQFLAHQPMPAGRRVGILASSASLAALVVEAVVSAGMTVARSGFIPEGVADGAIAEAIDELYTPDACDIVVVAHIPVAYPRPPAWTTQLARQAARTSRPTVASIFGLSGLTTELTVADPQDPTRLVVVPAYSTPENAVAALESVLGYVGWRNSDRGAPVNPDGIDRRAARALVDETLAAGSGLVDQDRSRALLAAYGIDVVPARQVSTADEAVTAANEVGYPVVVKSTVEGLRHRSDLGGVRLALGSAGEVRAAFCDVDEVNRSLAGDSDRNRITVQSMVSQGVACVVRALEDPLFGPVVSFGIAGDAIDLFDDIRDGIPPLTTIDISAMIRSARASARLFGYRGGPTADVAALEDLIARVSVLADDTPELRALELHPVLVAEHGLKVLRGSMELASPTGPRPDQRPALPA